MARNWPPYLTCQWLRINVLSNRHSPTCEVYGATFTCNDADYISQSGVVTVEQQTIVIGNALYKMSQARLYVQNVVAWDMLPMIVFLKRE